MESPPISMDSVGEAIKNGTTAMSAKKCRKRRNSEISEEEVCSNASKDMRYREALSHYIVLAELPVEHGDSGAFRDLSKFLNPDLVVPSTDSVAMDIFNWFKEEKMRLKNVLELQRISVTASIWTSNENINYMCVTAHWIDIDWTVQQMIIGFIPIPDIEEELVAQELMNCFNDWEITEVQTITMDDALSSDRTVDLVKHKLKEKNGIIVLDGELLHMRCVSDIINSIVEVGFDELAPSIARIRNALIYTRSSVTRLESFIDSVAVEANESTNPSFCMDVETKWTSTYKMLKTALSYRKALDRLKDDVSYRSYFDVGKLGGPPGDSDWINVKSFVRHLESFYSVVSYLSIDSVVTSDFCFVFICVVKKELHRLSKNANDHMRQMAVNMNAEFAYHWGAPEKINHVLFLGIILHPRYKMAYVAECLDSMYEAEAAQKLLKGVKASLYKLFEEYNDDPLEQESYPNEVDDYLSECLVDITDEEFYILDWWSDNVDRFSVLARIAKDLLAVPMSTVMSASVFSASECLLKMFQSPVSPVTLEVLVCSKNWLTTYR